MLRHFLKISDFSAQEIYQLLERAELFKKEKHFSSRLENKILALIFEKESTRTRVSFEVGIRRLGGSAIYLGGQSSQISRGESYKDTASVLSKYLDAIVCRTFSHQNLEELAQYSSIPIINGLSDDYHPCQVLADLMTIREYKSDIKKIKIAYIGDGNNMANSWIEASDLLKLDLHISTPKGYEPLLKDKVKLYTDAIPAVSNADVINTDTWFSMGQEVSDEKRKLFDPFQLNQNLLAKAKKDAIVLHCLPAHRGEEITDKVIDGKQSRVYVQAENRLYVQMALLEFLMKGNL